MKFSNKVFFSKSDQVSCGLGHIYRRNLNGKLHFLCSVPYSYTPSSSFVDLLLHLQHYKKCELMIWTMWLKNKFVLWQPRYYKLLTEKKDKEVQVFWSTDFFGILLLLSIPINYLQTPFLGYIHLGSFTLSKSVILMNDLIRWKRGFEILLIDHHAGDIGNKNIANKYLRTIVSVSPSLY